MTLRSPTLQRCFATALIGAAAAGCQASHATRDDSQAQGANAPEPAAGTSAPDWDEPNADETGCTLIGCLSTLTVYAPLPDSIEAIRALWLGVCLNGACNVIEFAAVKDHLTVGNTGIVSYDESRPVDSAVWLTISRESGHNQLKAVWPLPHAGALRDGDHYRVTLSDESAQPWRVVEESVTYTWSFPNGEQCPPGCRHADLRAPP
jgi:hypothetical protein